MTSVLGLLNGSHGDVLKYLAPHHVALLELCLPRERASASGDGGDGGIVHRAVVRRHTEAAGAGATLVPLEAGRVTCAAELREVAMATARLHVGPKKTIGAGLGLTLVASGTDTWELGSDISIRRRNVELQDVPTEDRQPRLIRSLRGVRVVQVAVAQDRWVEGEEGRELTREPMEHSMILTSDGDVWTWGDGRGGALGHGNVDVQRAPTQVDFEQDVHVHVVDIATGRCHCIVATDNGQVYAWGSTDSGQIGMLNDRQGYLVPTAVPGIARAAAVAAGENNSFVVFRDGTVVATGENNEYQLGIGHCESREKFTTVPRLRDVVDMDTGYDHAIALSCTGDVWTWGVDLTRVCEKHAYRKFPTKVVVGDPGDGVVHVVAGVGHCMALTETHRLYTWGHGAQGQLGHGDTRSLSEPTCVDGVRVAGMAGGTEHSVVVTVDGGVYSFGTGISRLGLGDVGEEVSTPTQIVGIRA